VSAGLRRVVPFLQPVYDLMWADVETDVAAVEKVAAWSRRTGLRLPAAVYEFYTSVVRIPMVDNATGDRSPVDWTLPVTDLWREFYGVDQHLLSLEEVLAATQRARVGGDPLTGWPVQARPAPAQCGPLVNFEAETHLTVLCCFDAATPGDPPVWSYAHAGARVPWGEGWGCDSATFSGWLLDWFASWYHEDGVPLSFFGPDAEPEPLRCPVMPYSNGLWAYALDRPVEPHVVEELSARYGEAVCRSRVGGATFYCWELPGGTVAVTSDRHAGTDEPADGVASWWIHGYTPQVFAELLHSVRGYGTLRQTLANSPLCANHTEAAAMIAAIRHSAS
jgi:hypothetical protein